MSPVRVFHVLGTMSLHDAGPAHAAINLAKSCQPFGVQAEFFTTDLRGRPVDAGDFPVHCFPAHAGRFAYSRQLREQLRRKLGSATICHIHGVWLYPTLAAAWEAQRARIPYIVSPHGMLAPFWFRSWKGLRNRTLLRLVQGKILARAAAIHIVNEQEHRDAIGLRGARTVVIANCIASRAPVPRLASRPHLLSLSILHPRKNIECLIRALSLLPEPLRSHATLRIAGSGPPAETERLRALAAQCDPGGRSIEFVGDVRGAAKANLMDWASLLCLASYSEGQPSAALEALAAGLPVVISAAANLPEVAAYAAGVVAAHNQPEDFAQGMAELLLDTDRYRAASRAALRLVDEQFLAGAVGQRWADLYASLAPRREAAAAAR
ncbi:MAG: glycosyltransferase [Terriglobales bacterium]